jgi:hypothetical protein
MITPAEQAKLNEYLAKQEQDAKRLRAKQDVLLGLADSLRLDDRLRIDSDNPQSPRLMDLRYMVFPNWESSIEQAIRLLEERTK